MEFVANTHRVKILKKNRIVIIVFALILAARFFGFVGCVEAETKVLDYGFEDWTGNADTTPNYFSSTSYQEYWTTHKTNTEVISSCNGNLPHGGNFYFHQNFYEGFDPCLGTTPTGINPHTNIGINLQYPSDPKNNLNLRTDILTDTMTIRFYFRTTGNWPNSADLSPMMKFIRVYGAGTTSAIIHISEDGTTFDIADHPAPDNPDPSWGDYHNIFTAPINWNDGEWHSISAVIELLNPDNVYPNVRYDVWWDNWDMEGSADGSADVYHPGFDSDFVHISLFVNWGARYPDNSMGLDMDDIEIWDGIPTTSPNCSNDAPTGELSSGTTSTSISLDTDETATCRYSTTPNIAYDDMTNTFSTTGGTTHSTTVSGLEDGHTYTYYVRAEDSSGNANTDDYEISFSVATQGIGDSGDDGGDDSSGGGCFIQTVAERFGELLEL